MTRTSSVAVRPWLGALVLLGLLNLAAYGLWRWRRDHRHDAVILEAAHRYGVPPELVKAVVWRESRFDEGAVGSKGELGLMQLMETAASEWADSVHATSFIHEHVLNPATNTLAGTFYLGRLLRRYPQTDNPVVYALADYNAGRGNVLRWMKGAAVTNSSAFLQQMTFPGTRAYVQDILAKARGYASRMDSEASPGGPRHDPKPR